MTTTPSPESQRVFAPGIFKDQVAIITGGGSGIGLATALELARLGGKVAICGRTPEKLEKATGVTLSPVSEEADVKSTLGKVTSGDADAGLVYATDVQAAGADVSGVHFPEAGRATTTYPIAALTNAPQPQLAQQFVDAVTGSDGQQALKEAGFGTGT